MSPCPPVHVVVQAAERALRRFARRIPPEVRAELCQETVLRLLRAETVRSPEAFAWQVAHRLALDHLRRDRWVELAGDPPAPEGCSIEHRVDARRVVKVVLSRSPGQGQVLEGLFLADREVDDLVPDGRGRERARDALYKRRERALRTARELFPELTRRTA